MTVLFVLFVCLEVFFFNYAGKLKSRKVETTFNKPFILLIYLFIVFFRRQKLDEIKKRKLQELRGAGVPDKYCNEVARRIEAPPPSLSRMY